MGFGMCVASRLVIVLLRTDWKPGGGAAHTWSLNRVTAAGDEDGYAIDTDPFQSDRVFRGWQDRNGVLDDGVQNLVLRPFSGMM